MIKLSDKNRYGLTYRQVRDANRVRAILPQCPNGVWKQTDVVYGKPYDIGSGTRLGRGYFALDGGRRVFFQNVDRIVD